MKEDTVLTHAAKPTDAPLFDRLMARAEIDENVGAVKKGMSWSMLKNMPGTLNNAIATVAIAVQEKVQTLNAYGYLDAETDSVVKTFAKDIQAIGNACDEIEKKHKDRGGRAKTPAEEQAVIGIYEEYTELNNRYQANISPALLNITERLSLLSSDIRSGKVAEITKAKS